MKKIITKKSLKSTIIATMVFSLVVASFSVTNENTSASTWPGYNGIIVTQTDDGLYSLNTDGTRNIQVSTTPYSSSSANWSPDGTRLAFQARHPENSWGNMEIYLVDPDGSNQVKVTTNTVWDGILGWSPDSSQLLYFSDISLRNLWIVDEDGTNTAQLTSQGNSLYASWSPDGQKILFSSDRDGDNEIYVMDADGSNQTRLTTATGSDDSPAWSPDGSKIAFISNRDGNSEIYSMNADGTNQSNLTNNAGRDYRFTWSPDGLSIAFASNRDRPTNEHDIFVLNIANSETHRLTDGVGVYNSPIWSPGGGDIIYRKAGSGSTESLIVQRPDGSDQRPVLEQPSQHPNAFSVSEYFFSPDGKHMLITYFTQDWMDSVLFKYNLETREFSQHTSVGDSYGAWQPVPNTPPAAVNDTFNAPFNTPTLFDVLANDTDEEAFSGANLSITSQPANGNASVVSGLIRYTPDTGYQGSDSLTYQICDSFTLDQLCATSTLNLIVLAPTAPSLTVTNVNGEHYSPEVNKYITSNLRPTFSGTATPGAEIRIEIHSDPIILTTTADGNGNWSVSPAFDLPSGEHMVYISATLYGLTTELGAFGLQIGMLANTGVSLSQILLIAIGMMATGSIGLLRRCAVRV